MPTSRRTNPAFKTTGADPYSNFGTNLLNIMSASVPDPKVGAAVRLSDARIADILTDNNRAGMLARNLVGHRDGSLANAVRNTDSLIDSRLDAQANDLTRTTASARANDALTAFRVFQKNNPTEGIVKGQILSAATPQGQAMATGQVPKTLEQLMVQNTLVNMPDVPVTNEHIAKMTAPFAERPDLGGSRITLPEAKAIAFGNLTDEEQAETQRHHMSETQARAAAFNSLTTPKQHVAVGPTLSQQAGSDLGSLPLINRQARLAPTLSQVDGANVGSLSEEDQLARVAAKPLTAAQEKATAINRVRAAVGDTGDFTRANAVDLHLSGMFDAATSLERKTIITKVLPAAAKKMMAKYTGIEQSVARIDELSNLLAENGSTIISAAGKISSSFEGLKSQAMAVSRMFGGKDEDVNEDDIAVRLSRYAGQSDFSKQALASAEVKSLVIGLAYALASSREGGGKLSTSDVNAAIDTIGGGLASADSFKGVLKRVRNQTTGDWKKELAFNKKFFGEKSWKEATNGAMKNIPLKGLSGEDVQTKKFADYSQASFEALAADPSPELQKYYGDLFGPTALEDALANMSQQ